MVTAHQEYIVKPAKFNLFATCTLASTCGEHPDAQPHSQAFYTNQFLIVCSMQLEVFIEHMPHVERPVQL